MVAPYLVFVILLLGVFLLLFCYSNPFPFLIHSQMLRMYGIFTYMKGEKWLHEQGEMATGKYSRPMEHLGLIFILFKYPRDPITLSDDDWGVQSPPKQGI